MRKRLKPYNDGVMEWDFTERGKDKMTTATCRCGTTLTGRKRVCDQCKRDRSPFNPEAAPYGTYEGMPGDPDSWAWAFRERFSQEEITKILKDRSPWEILGLEPGATQAEIKLAYRQKARDTHPDHHPDLGPGPFQDVQAAYEALWRE